MRAHMRGLRLMLVSVGQNRFLSNWTRIGIDNSRTGQAECICLVNLGTYLAGFYRKTVNRRLTAWQEDLGMINGSNVAWGQARMATG
jgi:hypothetical protein